MVEATDDQCLGLTETTVCATVGGVVGDDGADRSSIEHAIY
jgi:hypothetical protein